MGSPVSRGSDGSSTRVNRPVCRAYTRVGCFLSIESFRVGGWVFGWVGGVIPWVLGILGYVILACLKRDGIGLSLQK